VRYLNEEACINIENIVASAMISHRLDLDNIHMGIEETRYDENCFPALVYNRTYPRCLILIFNNGKLLCTGLNNRADVENVVQDLMEKLRECGEMLLDGVNIEVRSIIASAELNRKLDINDIYHRRLLENTEISNYEIRALVYRPAEEGMTCVIFPSGKIAFSGAKDLGQVEKVLKIIKEKL